MSKLRNPPQHGRRKLLAGVLTAAVALASGAFALSPVNPRPVGATLTYVSTIKGVTIQILSAKDDAGRPFAYADAYYAAQPELGGATMGAAPGGYGLPEWVKFEWREATDMERKENETYEAWGARVDEDTRKLVRKTERVYVASKIPVDAVEEVRKSQVATERGKLPDKMLRVYFVWTPSGVKVRWRVQRAHPGLFTEWQGERLE